MFYQRRLNKLIANLRHERPEIRRDAVVRLGKLKKRAGPALPNLQAALSDPDGLVRLAAQEAIESITAAVGQPSDTRPMVAGRDAMKSVIRCCICSSPINLEEERSYFRANFENICRTCLRQWGFGHPFTEAPGKTLPDPIYRIDAEDKKRESLKNGTGWLIIVFWFVSMLGGRWLVSMFSDHWFVKLVVAVVGLLACIWWLRRYGGDPEPGTPPWGGMGFGIWLSAYFFVLGIILIIGGMIMAFR